MSKEEKDTKEEVKESKEVVVEAPAPTVEEEILANLSLITKAVVNIEPRFTNRVLRTLTTLRKKLTKSILRKVLDAAFPKGSKTGQSLIASSIFQSLPEEMEVETEPTKATQEPVPECVVYLRLLILLSALDAGNVKEAAEFAMTTAESISSNNRRTMDQIAAKVFFYLARAYEIQGRLGELRPLLLATRQTAHLRQDETLEATVVNLLLRSYMASNQFEQADKLIAKVHFQGQANQAQTVRWLFYAGRLRAVQLNYAQAHQYLLTAIRRAPKDEVAPGFVQIVHKYFIIVTLLTGIIPDRAMFRKPVLKQALQPYFQIVQAVRVGDMAGFQKALTLHEQTFQADGTHFLILRLRHFVIKTALRTITLAYSKISLRDVCLKLHLDSEEDTEYIVAKAIKDQVIIASIDHQGGYMESKAGKDVYETDEPSKEFDKRVAYCTQLYNESVRAMRYPPNAHRKELDWAAETRERDREIVQLLQDAGDDDMEDM